MTTFRQSDDDRELLAIQRETSAWLSNACGTALVVTTIADTIPPRAVQFASPCERPNADKMHAHVAGQCTAENPFHFRCVLKAFHLHAGLSHYYAQSTAIALGLAAAVYTGLHEP